MNCINLFKNNLIKLQLKNINTFSKRKGLQQNIKSKSNKKIIDNQNSLSASSQNLVEISNMKILNMQFLPLPLLITPCLFYYEDMFDPNFLIGELLVQKYASLALLMNLDFQSDKAKTTLILTSMALLHVLTGYYSLGTPIGMAFLSIVSPFKFCNQKQKFTEIQSIRIKVMTNIRMIYFFIFVLITTVKAFHYEATYSIERKFESINKQNFNQVIHKESI